MLKIKLPTVEKSILTVDGKKQYAKKESTREFELDMSLAAEMRFEANFPELAKKEDIIAYTERIKKHNELTLPVIISKMKTLYCYLIADMTFTEFLQMFDFSDEEYIKKLTAEIKETFELVLNGSAEKN